MTLAVTALSFAVETRFRPFDLVAPGFVDDEHGPLGACTSVRTSERAPVAPFAAVELDVADAGEGTVVAGLSAPDGNSHVLVCYDRGTGRVGIDVRVDGVTTRVAERPAPPRPPRRLAFVLCENRVVLLLDVGEGWRPVVKERVKVSELVDLRRPETLSGLRYAWGARDGAATLGDVRAGLFGMAGLRDLHLVQHSDGRPYERDGRMFVTATCAGLGFFQQAHWGVFGFDPARPADLQHVAKLFSRRDGVVLGDHAGQLVRDEHDRGWLVATSSWGDFTPRRGVHVRHAATTADLLSGVHVLETERTPLPTHVGSWDPGLTRIDGRWHVTFVESPSQDPFDFHPALAVAAAGDDWTAGLTMAGAATDLHHCEGPLLARLGGTWSLLASDGEARRYPVFDLGLRQVGELDAPYGTNIPHPQLYPRPDGEWGLLTFDGTAFAEDRLGYGTHGDVVVMSTAAAGAAGSGDRPGAAPLTRVRRRLARVRRAVRGVRSRDEPETAPGPVEEPPALTVVVPFRDAGPALERCLDSLARQTLSRLEVVMVDDGSTDGSVDVARGYAERHQGFRLVAQGPRGVGPARDAGAREARGEFLTFCDSDDEVPPGAYERLVRTLRQSGSDIAIGAVAIKRRGIHQPPPWTRVSNPARRLGVRLDEVPGVLANLMPGTRVFSTPFWRAHGLSFGEDDHREVVTMVEALRAAGTIDVLAGVTYRWGWRDDGSSLLQRDRREADRIRCRMEHVHQAADLLPPPLRRRFLAEILDTQTPEIARAAVCRDDDFWEAFRSEVQRLVAEVSVEDLGDVSVEDRVLAWLCAREDRGTAEDYLEYAFSNEDGFPVRVVDGRPHADLSAVAGLASLDPTMTRVADVDLRYRSRLTGLRWVRPHVLHLEGAALVDYVERDGSEPVRVVLRHRATGAEVELATTPARDPEVNRWASRPYEDHSGAAFTCEVDVSALPHDDDDAAPWDVVVRLEVLGEWREASFDSRRANGSAGMLEPSRWEDRVVVPVWNPGLGLSLRVSPAGDDSAGTADGAEGADPPVVRVTGIEAGGDVVRLRYVADQPHEIALVGPRTRTGWGPSEPRGEELVATVDLLVDEWGLGRCSVPVDDYAVVARDGDGAETPVHVDHALWRTLELAVDGGTHLVFPRALEGGTLELGLVPGEQRDFFSSYDRTRLRDEAYPAARAESLLDVAMFESFGGRGTGDNPGPVCAELAGRGTGLDLVFSVQDRSVVVPEGARAVIRSSAEWYELLGRARYLVSNTPLPIWFRKREGQVVVNTWHGTPLKRLGHDREHVDFALWHHLRQLLRARAGWDFLLSQSPYCTETLTSAFRYEGRVLELGYPRNDVLTSPRADDVRRRTRERLGIDPDSRVVLYAPTWRETQRAGRVFDKVIYLDTDEVVRRVPGAVVLVRGHYQSFRAAAVRHPDPRIVDVTRYPDIADLYLAADALVTDYSSVFFDFALTDRPMYFLAPDLAHYRDVSRGLYVDYHSIVPGPVSVTTESVIEGLLGPDEHVETRRRFRERYTPWDDGHASERLVDVLLGDDAPPV